MTRDGTPGLQRAKQECPTCGAPAVWRVCANDHREKEFCGCGWHYMAPIEARPAQPAPAWDDSCGVTRAQAEAFGRGEGLPVKKRPALTVERDAVDEAARGLLAVLATINPGPFSRELYAAKDRLHDALSLPRLVGPAQEVHLPGCTSLIPLPEDAIVALRGKAPIAPLYYACTCARLKEGL